MDTILNYNNAFHLALQVCLIISAIGITAYATSWVGQWVWSWLDDSKVGHNNKFLELFMPLPKYRYPVADFGGEEAYWMSDCKEDSGKRRNRHSSNNSHIKGDLKRTGSMDNPPLGFKFFLLLFLMCISGQVIAIMYVNLHISLCIGGFFALAFTTRGGRRLQKKLDKHVNDKDAHK